MTSAEHVKALVFALDDRDETTVTEVLRAMMADGEALDALRLLLALVSTTARGVTPPKPVLDLWAAEAEQLERDSAALRLRSTKG
jgi:hypothetical protein